MWGNSLIHLLGSSGFSWHQEPRPSPRRKDCGKAGRPEARLGSGRQEKPRSPAYTERGGCFLQTVCLHRKKKICCGFLSPITLSIAQVVVEQASLNLVTAVTMLSGNVCSQMPPESAPSVYGILRGRRRRELKGVCVCRFHAPKFPLSGTGQMN